SEEFAMRGELMKAELKKVDQSIRTTMQSVPSDKRYLVTSHDAFNYYDCQVSGSLKTSKGEILNFWLNAGGHISLKSESQEFTLGAVSKELKSYFLSIQFSNEEGEIMMNSIDYISNLKDVIGTNWIHQPFAEHKDCIDSLFLFDGQGSYYSCERALDYRIEFQVKNHQLYVSVFDIENVGGNEFLSRKEIYELEFGQLKLKSAEIKRGDHWDTLDVNKFGSIVYQLYTDTRTKIPEATQFEFKNQKGNTIKITAEYKTYSLDDRYDLPIHLQIKVDSILTKDTIVEGYSNLYLSKIDSIAHKGFEFFSLKYGLEACDYPNNDLVFYTDGNKVHYLDELQWFFTDYAAQTEKLQLKNEQLIKLKSTVYHNNSEPNLHDTDFYNFYNGRFIKAETTFKSFLTEIPKLNLPIRSVCDYGFTPIDFKPSNQLFKKYIPNGGSLVGSFDMPNGRTAVIYTFASDILFPIIFIYNQKGKILNKINAFNLSDCIYSDFEKAQTHIIITKQFTLKKRIVEFGPSKDSLITTSSIDLNK
ncbi:MAG: hypothetical protein ACPGLV_16215, partial [Bacteroidia bacterium]